MRIETMLVLLVIIFMGYVVMSYKKLIHQHILMKKLNEDIQLQKKTSTNTDKLRRKYNAVARNYNHTIEGWIGRLLAQKLKYQKKDIIKKI